MSQPHNRGHASYTFDIQRVVQVDVDGRTITLEGVHAVAPFSVNIADKEFSLGVQMLMGVHDSLAVSGKGGAWESSHTLTNAVGLTNAVITKFLERGITDLSDTNVTLKLLREVVNDFDSSQKRTINKLLVRVLRDAGHPDKRLPERLANTKHVADDHVSPATYTDPEFEAVERAARRLIVRAIEDQSRVLRFLGYEVDEDTWMSIDPQDVIGKAGERDALRVRPMRHGTPPIGPSQRLEAVDFAVLNPEWSWGIAATRARQAWEKEAIALFPPTDVLCAGAILQCIADNTGVNAATILGTRADTTIVTGDFTAQVPFSKARNHTGGHRPARRTGIFTAGRLEQVMSALTRFSRHQRAHRLEVHGLLDDKGLLAQRIYVVDHPKLAALRTLDTADFAQLARRGRLTKLIRDEWHHPGPPPTIRLAAFRTACLRRGIHADPTHDVVDHTPRTKVDYLAHALPEVTLHRLVVEAQEEFHRTGLAVLADSAAAERLIAAAKRNELVDLGPTYCANAGKDPDQSPSGEWCSDGLVACFTCPMGFRTHDSVAGLLALKEYTDFIRLGNPIEWAEGEAGVLNHYARESLARYPQAVIDRTESTRDRDQDLLEIHLLYSEVRLA